MDFLTRVHIIVGYDASLFVIAFFVTSCFAYLNNANEEKMKQYSIYYLFASFSVLFMFSSLQDKAT